MYEKDYATRIVRVDPLELHEPLSTKRLFFRVEQWLIR